VRIRSPTFALLIAAPLMTTRVHAQAQVAVGGGIVVPDTRSSSWPTQGADAFVRLQSRSSPFLLEGSVLGLPKEQVAFVEGPCAPPPGPCSGGAAPFTGPVTVVTLSPGIRATESRSGASLSYWIGPSVSWLPDRAPGDASTSLGFRGGFTLRLGSAGAGGFLISADYLRLLGTSNGPRWFMPLTVGVQL